MADSSIQLWFIVILVFILAVKFSEYVYDIRQPRIVTQSPASPEPKDDDPPPYDDIDKYSIVETV